MPAAAARGNAARGKPRAGMTESSVSTSFSVSGFSDDVHMSSKLRPKS
jgi:hypothetical protein